MSFNTKQTELRHHDVMLALDKYVSPIVSTMGPGGLNVLLVNNGNYNLGKDGATVGAMSNYTDTAAEEIASILTREAQDHQLLRVGDGTSTTAFLVRAIYRALVDTGMAPNLVNHYLPRVKEIVRTAWDGLTEEVPMDEEDLFRMAMIASHGDEELSRVVAKAQVIADRSGFVYGQPVTEAYADEDQVFSSDGVVIPRGLNMRILDNSTPGQRFGFHVDGPCYWVVSQVRLADEKGIEQVFRYFDKLDKEVTAEEPTPVIFVCPDVDEKVRTKIVAQSRQSTGDASARQVAILELGAVEGPNGGFVQDTVEDLADVINPDGFYFSSRRNRYLAQVHTLAREYPAPISRTDGVVTITASNTEISLSEQGAARAKAKAERLRSFASQERQAGNEGMARSLEGRAARLAGTFPRVLLRKGTDSEKTRRFQLLDDTIRTMQSAVREGRVPGQGIGLCALGRSVFMAALPEYEDLPAPLYAMLVSLAEAVGTLRGHILSLMLGDDVAEAYDKALDYELSAGDRSAPARGGAPDEDILTRVITVDGMQFDPAEVGVYDSAAIGINAVLIALDTAAQLYDTRYVLHSAG